MPPPPDPPPVAPVPSAPVAPVPLEPVLTVSSPTDENSTWEWVVEEDDVASVPLDDALLAELVVASDALDDALLDPLEVMLLEPLVTPPPLAAVLRLARTAASRKVNFAW